MIPAYCEPYENVPFPCYWLGEDDAFWMNGAAHTDGPLKGNIESHLHRLLQGRRAPVSSFTLPYSDGGRAFLLTVLPLQGGILITSSEDVSPAIPSLSSQIREPVSNVLAILPLLAKKSDDTDAHYPEEVRDNCYKLLRLITNLENIYSLAHRSSPGQVLSLSEFLTQLANSVSSICWGQNIPVHTQISEVPLYIKADKRFLSEAILNVLRNSLQYTQDGNEILIVLRRVGTQALLVIEDRGIGIKPEHLEYIFDANYSVDPYGGDIPPPEMGMGLFVALQTMHRFGGTIAAESIFGKGTRISMSFPLIDADSIEDEVLSSDPTEYLLNRYSPIYVHLNGYCRLPDFV